ncbi:MAG: formate--tetrahydrofolate ligase, partial [Spirochaetaceae bacterium]|nr:formate--tetrahydrofolate ligase [Spirochaetaceae bacterium]
MNLLPIAEIAEIAGIAAKYVEPYGKYKAKIDSAIYDEVKNKEEGKLVLVTSITPTKAGEGKTTTAIALAEGMGRINQKAMLCLREPSLGPVFGLKGGATGGGKASIGPKDEINLHFTGDLHALTSSINLIAAVLDNSIYQGNLLNIDPSRVVWTRALDMNDRVLRNITIGMGKFNGVERTDHFVITVASELMAILCLAIDSNDFHERVKKIIVAYTYDNAPITVGDLRVSHAVMKLMKEALKPNLVQTVEHNPVFVHGGPFANIAHGCNSIIALKLAMKLAPITLTEAGFGADLGAEKFLDITCKVGGFKPSGAVVVATVKALKMHGGVDYGDLQKENVEALLKGVDNLKIHIENVKKYNIPIVVAINHFAFDTQAEIDALTAWCKDEGYCVSFLDGFEKGGEGTIDLAQKVVKMVNSDKGNYTSLYDINSPIKDKISKIAKNIYGANGVIYKEKAEEQLKQYEEMGFSNAYVCIAKTPNSLSDDPKKLGVPKDFSIT